MITLKNMPGLNSEAATEVALVTRSKVALGTFVSDIAKGGDVKLSNNISVSDTIDVTKGSNIDLNGHTVTASGTTPFKFSSGTSTITGGTVIGPSGVGATTIMVGSGATLTINGGTYSIGKDENGEGNSCIYSDGGTINITGGTFSSEGVFKGKHWVLNAKDGSSGKIEVSGGRFKNFNPSDAQTGEEEVTVKEGYEAKKDGDDWYVVAKTAVVSRKSKK